MRKLLTMMSALAALALAVPAYAANGVFSLNWDSCTGPLDKAIPQPADQLNAYPHTLMGSVVGHDVPHKAYEVWIIFGNGGTTPSVPDAWRFDAGACQGESFVALQHLAPSSVAKTCPSFQPAIPAQQIKSIQFVPDALPPQYSRTLLMGVIANSYPDASGQNVTPATRYFLAGYEFNHQYSVNGATTPGLDCGGLSTPMCFATIDASYLTLDGNDIPFEQGGSRVVSANGVAGCTPTPVQNKTWGAIKSQYRN